MLAPTNTGWLVGVGSPIKMGDSFVRPRDEYLATFFSASSKDEDEVLAQIPHPLRRSDVL